MIKNLKFKIINSQQGVSLIITFFIMIIILAVVLSVSVLLYGEIKVIRNIGNSVLGFYAADSGVEKVLFYDWQVLPITDTVEGIPVYAKRGLCSMVDYNLDNNPNACRSKDSAPGYDDSVYCSGLAELLDGANADGCDWDVCNNCKVTFNTNYASLFGEKEYRVVASVSPHSINVNGIDEPDGSTDLTIDSRGGFGTALRQIRVFIRGKESKGAFTVKNACANPVTTPEGVSVAVSVCIKLNVDNDTVRPPVEAFVYDEDPAPEISNLSLTKVEGTTDCGDGFEKWAGSWPTAGGGGQTYYVDLSITDTLPTPNTRRINKIAGYPLCVINQ